LDADAKLDRTQRPLLAHDLAQVFQFIRRLEVEL
jgi:hypothetical protein